MSITSFPYRCSCCFFCLLAARGSPRSTLSSSCSGVISLMSNSVSHLTWRRSAILLCLFQCFLSCFCFQVSASPPDLFAQFSVILQRVSFFLPSHQCQELWVLCISCLFCILVPFVFSSLTMCSQFSGLSSHKCLSIVSFQSSPASQCWKLRGLSVWRTFSPPFRFLSTSAMIGLWSVLL